jgi:hypothetical protein
MARNPRRACAQTALGPAHATGAPHRPCSVTRPPAATPAQGTENCAGPARRVAWHVPAAPVLHNGRGDGIARPPALPVWPRVPALPTVCPAPFRAAHGGHSEAAP